ncbi:MAG: hypothetical protein LC104_02345 [Bacteroidales bacterium]|nr:hypothetical protein [Bacteroidales bacterium]
MSRNSPHDVARRNGWAEKRFLRHHPGEQDLVGLRGGLAGKDVEQA